MKRKDGVAKRIASKNLKCTINHADTFILRGYTDGIEKELKAIGFAYNDISGYYEANRFRLSKEQHDAAKMMYKLSERFKNEV